MRWGLAFIFVALAGGCAASSSKLPAVTMGYRDAPASGLVFASPATLGQPSVFLPREERAPALFMGFDDLTTTFYYLRTDDRGGADGVDRVWRRAISERVGISYR